MTVSGKGGADVKYYQERQISQAIDKTLE
ncbi:hypothetical protein [Prosthecobacter sp.]